MEIEEWNVDIDLVYSTFYKPGENNSLQSKNFSKITQDQMAFIAQKDQAGGKKTLKAWYWMVEGAAYDQEHPRS